MEIAVLTSSRADFGFFIPLLIEAKKYSTFNLRIIALGTHLSKMHGYTLREIEKNGFKVHKKVNTLLKGDKPEDISKMIGLIHSKFADIWKKKEYDMILCLGDRYEIYAAVSASVPFNIPITHLSGGEETTGAIDNYFRHALTLMSSLHFTNTSKNTERVKQITGNSNNIVHSGSLAIDNIKKTILYSTKEFYNHFDFDITKPFILFTFHPETADYTKNEKYAKVIERVLLKVDGNILVTMPNADTMGSVIRKHLLKTSAKKKTIFLVESLGSVGYYTAMKHCSFVMGNSSSGIVEAASFAKYVLNMGDRQKGREQGKNVVNVEIDEKKILATVELIKKLPLYNGKNIYGDGNAASKICRTINQIIKND